MTNKEAIEELQLLAKVIEWDFELDYQLAIEKAIEALEKMDKSEDDMK